MTTQKPDDDVNVLLPDGQILIDGETVTVAEITFGQSLPLEPVIQPMIHDLKEMFADSTTDASEQEVDETLSYQSLAAVFGKHADLMMSLMSLSTGKPEDWVQSLSDEEGQLLTMTFWVVNKSFFTRRLVIETMAGRLRDVAPAQVGGASLPH